MSCWEEILPGLQKNKHSFPGLVKRNAAIYTIRKFDTQINKASFLSPKSLICHKLPLNYHLDDMFYFH